jgi:hypothetical protein
MKISVLSVLVGGILAAGQCNSLQATPLPVINPGNAAGQPNPGLDWPNVSLTVGQSDQGEATLDQILKLVDDVGATSVGTPGGAAGAAQEGATAVLLAQSDQNRSGMSYVGLPSAAYVPSAVVGAGMIRGGYPEEGFSDLPGAYAGAGYRSPALASAPGKTGPKTAVPEVTGSAAILSFSFGLILLSRKFHYSDCRKIQKPKDLTPWGGTKIN